MLDDPRLGVASVQAIVHTSPAPAPYLPQQSIAARSYTSVMADVPARRSVWVAVRVDPLEAPKAVAARGGGADGAARTCSPQCSGWPATCRAPG